VLLRRAGSLQDVQAGRHWRAAAAGRAAVRVDEENVAVGIEEVRRPERAQRRSEARGDVQALFKHCGYRHAVEQGAEGEFGIGVADRMEAAQRHARAQARHVQVPVVREYVHAPAQLAREGLAVLHRRRALRGAADVGDHHARNERMVVDEAHAFAVRRRLRLLDQAHVLARVVREPPAVLVRTQKAAMARERLERGARVGGKTARHREQFAHGGRLHQPPGAGLTGIKYRAARGAMVCT
jgi:hypothetical protein